MSDNIDIQVNDNDDTITITADEVTSNVGEVIGGDPYYTDLAKQWAIQMGSMVQGQDYSSKYYATQAKQSEEIATEAVSNIGTSVEDAQGYAEAAQGYAEDAEESAEYIVNHAPTVTVEQTETGATITATDMQGTTTATLLNGADGFSPIATVTKSGNVATITITDKNGTTTANVYDGSGGGSYTAGNGIDITNNTISVDTSVVATQTDIANMVTTNTAQDISGVKTFLGEKAIHFKQSTTTDKLGFTLYNPSDAELGALEYRPNTIDRKALLSVNCSYSSTSYVGFRYWGISGSGAANIIAPRIATSGNYYIPINVTDGVSTVTADNTGTVNISSLLSGGGAVIDDNTPSTTTVYSSQKTQDLIDALVARIVALETNINGGNA